ncbi:MAG: biotin--[acetyl-CoA-carboxylase] ligase [Anaerolineae bacterium]
MYRMGMTHDLQTLPDDLTTALRAGRPLTLPTRRLGHPLRYLPIVPSTQPLVHIAAQQGAGDGFVLLTDAQTAGKGRLGRVWQAPSGSSLLLSMLFRPAFSAPQGALGAPQGALGAPQGPRLTMCVGLGAAAAVEEVTGLPVQLKWPNDLLLHGKKLAGVLTETQLEGDRIAYAVVGLGLNVNLALPADHELAPTAISLSQALGQPVSRLALLQALLRHIEDHYARLQAGHSPYAAWAQRMAYYGQTVQVTLPDTTLTGTVAGVNPDGALLVQDAAGLTHTVWAGDVLLLRKKIADDR